MIYDNVMPEEPIGKLVYMYTEPWMEPEYDPLQVLYNNSYTALKLVCYYIKGTMRRKEAV